VSADHGIGEEATSLTVTVSDTCTAVAYNEQQVQATAIHLLAAQAARTFGAGYAPVGSVQVSVINAVTSPTSQEVALAFICSGVFAYLLTTQAQ